MANNSFTKMYEDLPKIVKVLIQLILGALVGGIYRILRWAETKNTTTLVVGILALIPPISFVFWVIDLVTEIANNRISVLAD
ncbi:MAG: hypothetical protein IJW29_03295 [Clostridia bacterium]|nr:hypothetical protein [Clostridia bacterium]